MTKKTLLGILSLLVLVMISLFTWYLSRLLAVSEYDEYVWLNDSSGKIPIVYKAVDSDVVLQLKNDATLAANHIEAFFQQTLLDSLIFYVLPDRAELDKHWRNSFDQPWFVSICWMVGTGSAKSLSILTPRVWETEDCGHDPHNRTETYKLIVHELTHSFHDQVNPSDDIGVYENIGWFIEGLAVHVSAQLEDEQLASPLEAICNEKYPVQLEDAWSGKYRYGVSGSMVEYIDFKWGRATLYNLMQYTTEPQILKELKVSEKEFISDWVNYVLSQSKGC